MLFDFKYYIHKLCPRKIVLFGYPLIGFVTVTFDATLKHVKIACQHPFVSRDIIYGRTPRINKRAKVRVFFPSKTHM